MMRDFRFAVRTLVKSPAFTFISVLAIALGIGGSTTMFSAINALLLRPMPLIQGQDRLLAVSQYFLKKPDVDAGVAHPDYLEFKKQATTLEGFAAMQEATMILAGGDKPARYLGAFISADCFSFLGVQPILGRNFRLEEDEPNAPPVALIGYDVWRNHFGSDSDVVGRVVNLNGKQTTIIGVMPRGWRFPEVSDLWMPLQVTEQEHPRGNFYLDALATVKPGVSIAQARSELEQIAARLAAQYPETNTGVSVHAKLFREELTENFKTLMLLVMGAVLFVHLIACGNVANLLLARGATRAREVGIRIALGATRRRIVRQLLAESIVIALVGCGLGLVFAVWGVDLMLAAIPTEIPAWIRFDFDWRIFSFAIGLGVFSSLLFGLVPALQISRPHLVDVLKEGGRSGTGAKSQRMRNGLVVAEVALAIVLLIGAGLMMRSFKVLQRTNIGADPSQTLTFRIALPENLFPDKEMPRQFFDELIPKLEVLPGVESVGGTTTLPASGNIGLDVVILEAEEEPKQLQDARLMRPLSVTPGFLRTARIQLLRGRDFSAADKKDAQPVCLIDEEAARVWFPNQDPIGHLIRHIVPMGEKRPWATIVGVVRPVIFDRLVRRNSHPVVYYPQAQETDRYMSIAMRTRTNPKSFVNAARATVQGANKDVPIYRIFTMDEVVTEGFWQVGFFSSLFTTFAGLALFLASLGLYGVMDYNVRQRTQEIGVRMALGAQTSDVLRMITGNGMRLVGLGLVIGMASAFFLMRLLASSLHGVSAHDPLSFTLVPLILLAVGLVACYVPARHAVRLNPTEALRYE